MKFHEIVWKSVGADLSCPSPIYRPSVGVPLSGLFCETALSASVDVQQYSLKVKVHSHEGEKCVD